MLFPACASAPDALLAVPGGCGPVSAWMVLRYFSMDVPAAAIVRACRHTAEDGTFMIALAVGLHELGLRTAFYTDPDAHPNPVERVCYGLARERGIPVRPALALPQALSRITPARVGLVCFDTPEGEGHVSPLAGCRDGRVLLPNTPAGALDIGAFDRRWQAPGILRQLVLASKESA